MSNRSPSSFGHNAIAYGWRSGGLEGLGDVGVFTQLEIVPVCDGSELLYRAGSLLIPGAPFAPLAPVVAAEIFVFHLCMTIVVYRLLQERSSAACKLVIVFATLYHVSVDFFAVLLYDPTHGRTLILWSILTPLHVAVAWHCFLGRTSFSLPVRGLMRLFRRPFVQDLGYDE